MTNTTSKTQTVVPLPKRDDSVFGPLRTKANRELMVAWINAKLFDRMGHDVRRSIVFYDDAGVFETALLPEEFDALGDKRELFLQKLYVATPIRFWSKGVK